MRGFVLTLLAACTLAGFAECSPQQAEANVRKYYSNIHDFVGASGKDQGFLIFVKNVMALIPEGFRMPNEPHMMFNAKQDPFLEPKLYASLFLNYIFPYQEEKERKSNNIELVGLKYGPVKQVYYPTDIDKSVDFNYFEMIVDKEYRVNNRSYSLRDTVNIRRSDGIVAAQRNKCGGTRFSQQETDVETLYILGESAWCRKNYQEAFTYYRRILEIKETSRVCFQLGLMMYDQWSSGHTFDPNIKRKKAGQYAMAYMKRAISIHDDSRYVRKAENAIYNLNNRD